VIGPSLRRLPANAQYSQETDIYVAGGIRTPNPSKRAAYTLHRAATGIGQFFYNFTNTATDSFIRWRRRRQRPYLQRSIGPKGPTRTYLPLNMRTLCSPETSVSVYPLTQRHIPEERNRRLYCCVSPNTPVINNSVIYQ
jgi:hypothetical protein